jgi:transposase
MPTPLTIPELLSVISSQQAQLASQAARIAELERRLGLNSSNSGKPPSSDGPKKPRRTASLRERSGRRSGGQKNHPGSTLAQSATPDAVIDHYPENCSGCGAALTETMATDHAARQVFDLPEPRPLEVTEHRAHRCQCAGCGAATRAAFPAAVTAPVQYGPRIGAFVTYLQNYQLLPEKRLAALMADLFGVRLATATIANMARDCADRIQGLVVLVRDHIAAAKVKHLDETSFRITGKTQWLHVAATRWLTCYRATPKRGSLPEGLTGVIVHDHWKPYYTLDNVTHALCNAHHLREVRALIEIEQEDWARHMHRLLRRACHATNLARDRGVPIPPRLIGLIDRSYDRIIAIGLAFHEAETPLVRNGKRGRHPHRIGHNLLIRLSTRKQDVLRFLIDPDVPFTNNLAEQDGRMMKLREKISGGFRSDIGADIFADIRTLLSTARKQGWNMLEALLEPPDSLRKRLRVA